MSSRTPQRWIVLEATELVRTPIFRLTARRSRRAERAAEEPHEFYVLETPEWVNVIPLTDDHRVLLVRQYRHGREELTLEIPGGMVDPEDQCPADAARRELLEETGYLAHRVEPIGTIAPNPAFQNSLCHSFVATELEQRSLPCWDSTEEMELELVPLSEIPTLIRTGRISHALVVVAFCGLLGLNDRVR